MKMVMIVLMFLIMV